MNYHAEKAARERAQAMLEMSRFDMLIYIARQRTWSADTFGSGDRTQGVLDHIRKELGEIEENPDDLEEWIDVIILALDGAWRRGYSPQRIVDALAAKQLKNMQREWPDWREAAPDQAIEHVRDAEVYGTGFMKGGQRVDPQDVYKSPPQDREHDEPGDLDYLEIPRFLRQESYEPQVLIRSKGSGMYFAAPGDGLVFTMQEAHRYPLSEAQKLVGSSPQHLQMVSVGWRTDAGRQA